MDNLIAEGKVRLFLIVMTYGMTNDVRPGGPPGGAPDAGATGAGAATRPATRRVGGLANFNIRPFQTVLVDELIPYVDGNFRTLSDQPHRAMASLSMGGMETKRITLANLDKFSHIGLFSGGTITPEDVDKSPALRKRSTSPSAVAAAGKTPRTSMRIMRRLTRSA